MKRTFKATIKTEFGREIMAVLSEDNERYKNESISSV